MILLHGRDVLVGEKNFICHGWALAALQYFSTGLIPFSDLSDPDASHHCLFQMNRAESDSGAVMLELRSCYVTAALCNVCDFRQMSSSQSEFNGLSLKHHYERINR